MPRYGRAQQQGGGFYEPAPVQQPRRRAEQQPQAAAAGEPRPAKPRARTARPRAYSLPRNGREYVGETRSLESNDDGLTSRKRLRRSSTVSSKSACDPGQSQEAGGDLDIGPPSTEHQLRASRAPNFSGGGAAVAPMADPGAAETSASAAQIEPVQIPETPAPVRDGIDPETALASVYLTPASALEIMQRLEGCSTAEALKLASVCVAYVLSNFERVVQCEEFLSLSFGRMEQIIADDELDVSSEDVVYAAVMSWVRHDIALRQHAELDKLLRLVRHPATSSRAPLLEDDLMLQHTELRCSILYHCQHEFEQSVKNIDHYQLRPRINCYGFREFDSVHPSVSILAAGAAIRKEDGFDNMYATALCGTKDGNGVMTGGRHRMQFELLSYSGKSLMIGICSPNFQPVTNTGGAHYSTAGYAFNAYNGSLYHDAGAKRLQAKAMAREGFESSNPGAGVRWKGSQKAKQGDKLDLCLDFEKGTLSLIKNGQMLGTLAGPSKVNPSAPKLEAGTGEGRGFVWMVEMTTAQDCVRVRRAKGSDNDWHSPSSGAAAAAADS